MATALSGTGAPIFPTADDFRKAADKYFDACDATGELYSVAGLCLGLKKYGPNRRFVSRDTLEDWARGETKIEGLQDAALEAFLRIEHQLETDERYKDKALNTRAIFFLKRPSLGGYRDVQKEDKSKVEVVLKHGDDIDTSDFA